MNDFLKIGIIIPAYKVEQYIFRALDSCIAQTYKNIEVVVVDDGSPDGTFDVIKTYADKDDRIKLYRQENSGVSSARNKALDMCTADYVLFLDSDDWLEPDAVEKLIQRAGSNKEERALISSGCYYAYFNESNEIYKEIPENATIETTLTSDEVLMFVGQSKYNLRSSCYKLFSLDLINENRLRFDPGIRHGEDGLFVFEYLKHADKFVFLPDPLWNILERPGSATMSPYNRSKMSALTAIEKMLAYDNREELQKALRVFYVQRALYVLGDAVCASPIPKEDVKFLRKKLRLEFGMYMKAQKSFKLKILYLLETFAPKKIVAKTIEGRKKK